ncbi:hypothetical protein LNL84_08625 [Vibrio sp. ZSDZ34]|uniref:DUF4019 domain-containing protein n=1 Tax=Vibrio gelatinilyticus TaxID=2893468 RepID=A0A9X2AVI4_9VIBR|nr:hypothetical protein [Vibrio gelatinilyticus]MCJ2376899.1 hypothetical protein [Vibrio gelatinilyticus]
MPLMKKLLVLLFFITSLHVNAKGDIDLMLSHTMKSYIEGGVGKIEQMWPLSDGIEKRPFVDTFRAIEGYYGSAISYDVINVSNVSPKAIVVYIAVNYEKGVGFIRMQVYRTHKDKYIITYANVHTEAYKIMPSRLTLKINEE